MPFAVCPGCRLPLARLKTGPCSECWASLLVSPAICANCLGFDCHPHECARPWLTIAGPGGELRFDSVTAAYLSLGPGARVLKSWKTSPSPGLDHGLRVGVARALDPFSISAPLTLIPIPQNSARRWELEGGSVTRLCEMVRAVRRNPGDQILDLLELEESKSSQALSRGEARYSRKSAIRSRDEFGIDPKDNRILLVDDFLTSGSTLRSGVSVIREKFSRLGGFRRQIRIDVFVLGFRPTLFDREAGG